MATVAIGAAAALAPSSAMAADSCPNAAVRAQQNATQLPSCLAYEKATPDNKGGETPGVMLVAEDGGGFAFALNAGIADAQAFVNGRFRSVRSADGGWTTTSLGPALNGPVLPALNAGTSGPHALTPDLSQAVVSTTYALDPNDQGIRLPAAKLGTLDVYLREADGSFRWLVPDPSVPDTSQEDVNFAAASRDLERVLLATQRPWDARTADSGYRHLYLWTRQGTHLVNVLPNGDAAAGTPNTENAEKEVSGIQASADARRVAFSDAASGRLYVRYNADDPATAFTRDAAASMNGVTCASAGTPYLSDDGKQLIFSCFVADAPGGEEVRTYIRDLDGGPDAVRMLGTGGGRVVAANADFSRVYLDRLNGSGSLFLLRDGEAPEPVVTAAEGSWSGAPEGEEPPAFLSADGDYLAFGATSDLRAAGVDHSTLTGTQAYRYQASTDTLTCVSCRRDGSPTEGAGGFSPYDVGAGGGGGGGGLAGGRPVATNGTVAFSSVSALVPEDTNGVADAYAWIDGRAVLLSSGRGALTSIVQGASADGSSLFFRTTDALVSDDRDGGAYDVYVARVNGGKLVPDPPTPPCTANCQGPAPERPARPIAGSTEAGGGGNAKTPPRVPTPRTTVTVSAPTTVRGTRTTVRVKVSRAGAIRLSGSRLRTSTTRVKKAGTYRVTVRLSARGAKQRRTSGRVRARVTARFTPVTGASVSTRKTVTFTTKKGGR